MTYTFKKSRGKFVLTSSIEPGYEWVTTSRSEVERYVPISLQVAAFDWRQVNEFMAEVLTIVRPKRKHKTNKCTITRS